MKDITITCGKLSDLLTFNKSMKDMAQMGYEPVKMAHVTSIGHGYDICVLLVKN